MVESVTHATITNPARHIGTTFNMVSAAAIYTGDLVYVSADNTVTASAGTSTPIGVALAPASAAGITIPIAGNGSVVKVWGSDTAPILAGSELAASIAGTLAGGVYLAPAYGGTTIAATVIGVVVDDLGSSQIVYALLNIHVRSGQ